MKLKLEPMREQNLTSRKVLIALDKGIKEYTAVIDGFERSWQEYVPSSYDPEKKYPILFTLHGIGGHDTNQKFAWALVAEREGFIVIYPQSVSNKISWNAFGRWSDQKEYPNEIVYLDTLYDMMMKKYSVDPERVYIHGQSLGDMMTTNYLLEHADKFAAACPSAGPMAASILYNEDGSEKDPVTSTLPITRMHGTLDSIVFAPKEDLEQMDSDTMLKLKLETQVLPSLEIWKHKNQCSQYPKLSVRGRYNTVHYLSDCDCDTWFFAVEGGEHNPSPEYADHLWSYFLSGYRRINGHTVKSEPNKAFIEDQGAVALADGSDTAYVNNQPVKMSGKAHFLSGRLFPKGNMYVPADFVDQAFGSKTLFSDEGMTAEFSLNGKKLQVAAGVRAAVLDEHIEFMPLCLDIDGVLYVPLGKIAEYLLGMKTLNHSGAAYITHSEGVLTYDLAYVIKQLLGASEQMEPREWYEADMRTRKDLVSNI